MKERMKRAVTLLLVLVLLTCGGYVLWCELDRAHGEQDYVQAVEIAGVLPPAPEPEPEPEPDILQDPWASALSDVDLDALREVNPEVLAWIAIPDTILSYPVVQCGDNQYYLNRTWQDKRSSVGAIFMECKCTPDFSDFNTIVYGHRMNNESMFGILHSFHEERFWREHPAVYVTMDDKVRVYDIYAAFEVGIQEIIYRLDVEENGQEQEFIDFGLGHSVIDTGIVPVPGDQILTLSTCTGRGHETRWVVQGVLREEFVRQAKA